MAAAVKNPEQAEFTDKIKAMEAALKKCKSADDIKVWWADFSRTVGYRHAGRLLVGMTAEEVVAKKFKD